MLVLVLLGSCMVTCGDISPDLPSTVIHYSDTCQYSGDYYTCGYRCIWSGTDCECGNTSKVIMRDAQQCCVPAEASQGRRGAGFVTKDRQCSRKYSYDDAKCAGGVIGIHELCHSRCYNSYIDSEYLGQHAHFPCPDQCVPYRDMCRGVAWCREELQHCRDRLRCQTYKYYVTHAVFGSTVTLTRHNLTTSLAPSHHYCLADEDINNGLYESVDRSDETLSSNTSQKIDYADLLVPCVTDGNSENNSYMCNGQCLSPYYWCAGIKFGSCNYSTPINTADPALCRDTRLWRGLSCDWYDPDGSLFSISWRCTGTMQTCPIIWYLHKDGYQRTEYQSRSRCQDGSDQVFRLNSTCSSSEYLRIHNEKFPNMILSFEYGWPLGFNPRTQDEHDLPFLDPHNCRSSCLVPEDNCLACTNPSYFSCPLSGVCIHPDLRCDGHPQCQFAEDEVFEDCKEKYYRKKIIDDRI